MTDTAAGRIDAQQAAALRKQIAHITRNGQLRTVITDSESCDGIGIVCTSPEHPTDDGAEFWAYDCCDADVSEPHLGEPFAAFVVAATAAIPALLDEREQLAARVAELEGSRVREVRAAHSAGWLDHSEWVAERNRSGFTARETAGQAYTATRIAGWHAPAEPASGEPQTTRDTETDRT